MGMISALLNNKIQSFEQVFRVRDITTSEMREAITDWYNLYYQQTPTRQGDPCQRLPVAIVSKLCKTAFSEYDASVNKEGAKSEYLSKILLALDKVRKKAMQSTLIGGECFLKPIFTAQGVCFCVIDRRNFVVLSRDEQGEIVDIGTCKKTIAGGKYYTLLERRSVDYHGYLTIVSRLFCSQNENALGEEISLNSLEKYAAIKPINRLPKPVYSLGLVPLQVPVENCVDGSPDPVSVYAAAAGLIHLINVNESQINGEFERGESRIIVSNDLMSPDERGGFGFKDHVFSGLDHSPDELGVTIFSPAFREQSFLARKAEYLRNCESLIGLKRGILSEVEAAERTATEVTSSAGDYNLTIIDFQQMWERAVREAVRVCDVLGQIYKVCDTAPVDPEKDIAVSWGNGILYDENKVWSEYTGMVSSGLLKPEIALAWYFDLPCDTPEDLMAIREKYMPELERLAEE